MRFLRFFLIDVPIFLIGTVCLLLALGHHYILSPLIKKIRK